MTTSPDLKTLFRRRFDGRNGKTLNIPGFHKSAVLVPLLQNDGGFTVLFTRRTETVETHKGQISFPGGMADGIDSSLVETALREAHEEIGLLKENVEVLGVLDDIPTPTGFVITPVVGLMAVRPHLKLNSNEVAEVFEVSLDFLSHSANARMEKRMVGGREYEIWFYDAGSHIIWGATGRIVRDLLVTLGGAR
jgi:8-oxo-dGTP pyrophosphatase MutT (NUDIX family)